MMKRTLKFALLASAAAFVLGMATPGQAQQENMRANAAASQRVRQSAAANRNAAMRTYETEDEGSEAYAYQPMGAGGYDSCATEGSYGQGLDYSACGGGD